MKHNGIIDGTDTTSHRWSNSGNTTLLVNDVDSAQRDSARLSSTQLTTTPLSKSVYDETVFDECLDVDLALDLDRDIQCA